MSAGIRVLRGNPDHEELAAVTAVLLALAARDEASLRAALARPGAAWALRAGSHRTAGAWASAPRPTWQPPL
ncbi:acyl-CoA carboxylase subunit epsilon [Streptomyces sp. SH5]|uniref:Acyl-CoA carboxylase subunit epsilon n=1 Tax=Streptomyces sindenensis TaxID=67363 RepID=A0ABW6EK02_9ACTN|nr:acyl-CoA carboxylase subunit epsilon [Streptomyces sp. SH5]WGP09684.1 acyl-CoA carboxylase subunit epsilon [Streptomyces sp. SH5]